MIVTEVKTVQLEVCIPDNPFFVRWFNPLGGWDSWLFGTRQVHAFDVDDLDTFQPNINYLQIANGVQQVLGKEAFELVTVGYEGLIKSQVDGIKYLLTSPKVYYINGTPGSNDFIRLEILVKPGTFRIYDNGDGKHSMEITLIKPKLQIQTQ